MPIVTLTTDFGADIYAAVMKGVILGINPRAVVVDITHSVHPQSVEEGAFLTQAAWPYFPQGSIHIAVVDPGVGTERRALALANSSGIFVGPDNGVLSAALLQGARPDEAGPVPVPQGLRAVALTNPAYFRHLVSATFHGRDIFAPVAAHLSLGVPLGEMGEPVEALYALPPFRARRLADGSLVGRVVHIDSFGNLVTDVLGEDLPGDRIAAEIAGRRVRGLSRAYQGGPEILALVGSSGYLEVAVRNGSAAALLGVGLGAAVTVYGAS